MRKLTSLSLKDIVDKVGDVYPDHFLQRQFTQTAQTNVDALSVTETLAAYLIKEFEDLYDPKSDDDANLDRIITNLEVSEHVISKVIRRLRELGRAP